MNAKQRDAIQSLRDVLKLFMELDSTMTLNRLETLLAVYCEGISDMGDLRDHMSQNHGLSKSALSRMVSWWGEEAYLQFKVDAEGNATIPVRPDGQGFLKFTADPRDYRRRIITVEPDGEQFAKHLADTITAKAKELAA